MRWSSLAVWTFAVIGLGACGNDSPGGSATDSATGSTGMAPSTSTSSAETGQVDETGQESTGPGEETGEPGCVEDAQCDDGNECTVDACDDGECAEPEAISSNDCRPQIEVDFPPRAATLADASPIVTVTGSVSSAAGPIAWLELNGEDVQVGGDGSFSHEISAIAGGNTLVFETEDVYEVPRRRVQSFLWSTGYHLPVTPEAEIANEGLGIYLDQETIDDNDRTMPPDDIATLMHLAVQTIDISQFVPAGAIYTGGGYSVFVTDVSYSTASVALESMDGGVHLTASLNGIDGDLFFQCVEPFCFDQHQTGGFTATSIAGTAELEVTVDGNNELVVTPANVQTTVNNLDLTVDNVVVNFLLAFIEPIIIGGIVADIEAQLEAEIENTLGPALSEAFTGLAPNSILVFPNIADAADPIEVELVTDFFSTDFHDGSAPPAPSPPRGGVIAMRGGGYPLDVVTPHVNLGVPDRAQCGEGPSQITMSRSAALEIGLSDDLLNQLLNGAWRGGLLEFDMPDELLGPDSDLISDLEIHISGMLAPTASDCAPDGIVRAHLGDVRIDGSLLLNGSPVTFVAFSSLLANLDFSTTESGVAVTIGDVEDIQTELTVAEDDQIDAEAVLVPALESQLVDGLIDAIAQGGLGEINLPGIDLSQTLGLPAGTAAISITTDSVDREAGTTVISGHL